MKHIFLVTLELVVDDDSEYDATAAATDVESRLNGLSWLKAENVTAYKLDPKDHE
jgi:hypothetical protein